MNGFTTEDDSRGDEPMDTSQRLVAIGAAASASASSTNALNHSQICCLIDRGERCTRVAGNASYNKRIGKTVAQRKLQLQLDGGAQHIYICDHHKTVILMSRPRRMRRDTADHLEEEAAGSRSPDHDDDYPDVDLFQLGMNTLRRYRKQWSIHTRPGLTKPQLADHLTRHFKTLQVTEKEVLTYFIYMAKNYKSKLDQKHVTSAPPTDASAAGGNGGRS